jgi:hypothetical protein
MQQNALRTAHSTAFGLRCSFVIGHSCFVIGAFAKLARDFDWFAPDVCAWKNWTSSASRSASPRSPELIFTSPFLPLASRSSAMLGKNFSVAVSLPNGNKSPPASQDRAHS